MVNFSLFDVRGFSRPSMVFIVYIYGYYCTHYVNFAMFWCCGEHYADFSMFWCCGEQMSFLLGTHYAIFVFWYCVLDINWMVRRVLKIFSMVGFIQAGGDSNGSL